MLACLRRAPRVTRPGRRMRAESAARRHAPWPSQPATTSAARTSRWRWPRTAAPSRSRQIACPLWQGLDPLDAAFAEAAPLIARADAPRGDHDRRAVRAVPRPAQRRRGDPRSAWWRCSVPDMRIWMGPRGFGSTEEARADPMSVASTNFLASAALVARRMPDALLIDMGSTTTDIIPIAGGKPAPRGLTDARAAGDRRACLHRADPHRRERRHATGKFQGREQRLAAGGFANMADVRRILGELPEASTSTRTPTGAASRSRKASRASRAASAATPAMHRSTIGAPRRAISPTGR